ncbi:MAG: chain length determinant protein EpsF [Burkholderiales bacterium]|jgi:succinoglycan biosynthesis transport protein ExoP|nr:MAG: chain length determinant protein EpsF [Burkholderiales bacterium]
MTFAQIFAILRARWIVALSLFVLVLGGVAVYTSTMPKSYTATASVLLDVKNADPIAGTVSPSLTSPAYLMTQVDIINSKRVAMRLIRNMKLNESQEMRARWQVATQGTGDYVGWLGALLQSSMEARPSRGSNVIYISYKAADPNFASAVANGFVQAYLETVLELRTSPARQSKDFLEATARTARQALEESQAKLSEYQRTQGLLVTDERLDIETARLNELSNQVVMIQSTSMDSGSRQAAAAVQGERSPDVMSSPLVVTLKTELARQQTSLEQMTTRLGEEHPQVREIKSGIADTSRKLEEEIRRVSSSVGVGNSVNVSRLGQLRAALEEQRVKVMKMKSTRDGAAILVRDVENAQRAYDGVLARMNNTNLESQANQANISALETAVAPSVPSSPNIKANISMGGLVAAALALAAALMVEYMDRRLRIQSEVERLTSQPLIGCIPSFKKSRAVGLASRLRLKSTPPVRALPYEA